MTVSDSVSLLLYEAKQLPVLQNRVYDTEAEARACPKGDVRLIQDLRTGLVYNQAFRPDSITYDEAYQNEQAVSLRFREHLEAVIRMIGRHMGNVPLVEIGCGKGFFLEMLLAEGFDVIGYDPAYEGENPRVIKNYFTAGSGLELGGIVLRHVLEHLQDPVGFLMSLRDAAGCRGKIYIEVPCFDWILRHRAWFDIFYEHVNYFRVSDFYRMFGTVHDSGHLFGGQYFYVIADLASVREPGSNPGDRVVFPPDFTRGIRTQSKNKSPIAVWGGASKGVIFSLFMQRAGQSIDTVIDINPAKQGKYLPVTGLLVQSPEEALSHLPSDAVIYVMNSVYLDEIRKMSGNAYRYVGVDCE